MWYTTGCSCLTTVLLAASPRAEKRQCYRTTALPTTYQSLKLVKFPPSPHHAACVTHKSKEEISSYFINQRALRPWKPLTAVVDNTPKLTVADRSFEHISSNDVGIGHVLLWVPPYHTFSFYQLIRCQCDHYHGYHTVSRQIKPSFNRRKGNASPVPTHLATDASGGKTPNIRKPDIMWRCN